MHAEVFEPQHEHTTPVPVRVREGGDNDRAGVTTAVDNTGKHTAAHSWPTREFEYTALGVMAW